MKKKIYIAGPMSGLPNANSDMFERASAALMLEGWIPVSPVDVDIALGHMDVFDNEEPAPSPTLEEKKKYSMWNLLAICECDAICFLPGWTTSKGAIYEWATANRFGLGMYLFDPPRATAVEASIATIIKAYDLKALEQLLDEGSSETEDSVEQAA